MRHGRRQFRPAVTGLEGRQLMAASALSTVATFSKSNESVVSPLVMDGQGNLYGSTSGGGEGHGAADATVFEIPAGTQKVETLATFNGRTGYVISGVTVDTQGDVFGTISGEGGTIGNGQAFEIPAGTKTIDTLASFNNYLEEYPDGVIEGPAGNLFGTAAIGGQFGVATIFEVAKGSGVVTPLAGFDGAAPAPKGLVEDAQGDLFGTNAGGGKLGIGSVYELPKGSSTIETLATFDGLNGAGISNVTMDAQGNLYGTTEDGGQYNVGSIFEIAKGSNTVTTLASFDTLNGSEPDPRVGLVMDAEGNLYGTTEAGGANNTNTGTVFELPKGSSTITTLATFKNSSGPLVSGLMLDGQGDLYGSINGTGSSGGTIFKVVLAKTAASTAT
jgi:uncharacterized repeat protein (TIGR03803 family)